MSKSTVTQPTTEMRVWQVLMRARGPMLPMEIADTLRRMGHKTKDRRGLNHAVSKALDRLKGKGVTKSGWVIIDEAFTPRDERKFQQVRPYRRKTNAADLYMD